MGFKRKHPVFIKDTGEKKIPKTYRDFKITNLEESKQIELEDKLRKNQKV